MFPQQYTEFELIGRGNFGTAHLVRSKRDQKVYVAKKIVLNTLKDKEQNDALRESSLLQKLNHPHIVSYVESFNENDTLIIVMEYCEGSSNCVKINLEGDVSFHIKRKKQRDEHFPEKLILNWFLQCAMALKYIHANKILHRDIKSSNIFVTSNGFVKIGDFGISRVLEHTYDQANTVVGTPYYMSPEVCENKPYTFKSDVWALGCVLYELCTLKHAFDANNLLGLVYKIVRDEVPDIPNIYSKDLQILVKNLLQKNDANRPYIQNIFEMEFIQKEMLEFIKNNGKPTGDSQIPIKRTQTHQEIQKQIQKDRVDPNEETMQTQKSGYMDTRSMGQDKNSTLTPVQKMKLKKEEDAEKQRQLLNQAARDNIKNNQSSQQKRIDDLAGSNSALLKKSSPQVSQMPIKASSFQVSSQVQKPVSNFDQTGKSLTLVSQYEQTSSQRQSSPFGFDQTTQSNLEITLKSDTIFVPIQEQERYFNDRPQQVQVTSSQLDRFTNARQQQNDHNGTVKTDFGKEALGVTSLYADEEFEEYYSDEEMDQPRLTEQAGEREVTDVLSLYKNQLSSTQKTLSKPRGLDEVREQNEIGHSSQSSFNLKDNTPAKTNTSEGRIQNLRKSAITKLGSDLYNKIYSYMSHHRQKGTKDDELKKSLTDMVGKSKYSDCQIIDEIIFLEGMQK